MRPLRQEGRVPDRPAARLSGDYFGCAGAAAAAWTGITIGVAGVVTTRGACAATGIASGTSSSVNALMIDPAGTTALVPVMKKPAGRNTMPETNAAPTRRQR